MKELFILLAPVLWSIKNDLLRGNKSFYKKVFFYTLSSGIFIFLVTKLLNTGMVKLQSLSTEVFNIILIKGYSLIFIIIFSIQIINGFVISLNTFYQSKELELLFTSPVNRISLFFSRLFETHLRSSWMLIIFGIPLLVSLGLLFHADITYYFYSLVLFTVFSIIPVNIGIGAAMILSGVFYISRLKRFIFSAGVISVIVIVTLLRIFRPERFINPELFANLTLFISEVKTPAFILLPNRWLSDSLFSILNKEYENMIIFILLLFLTSYITTFLLQIIFKKYHYRGWSLLQGGGIILKKGLHASHIFNFRKKVIYSRPVQRLLSLLDIQTRRLLGKDLACQIRDIKNVRQLLILLSLIIVYLFSIASLPMNWENIYYAIKIKYIVSFFDLGLILIIIASLCSRLVYPAVASEGNSLWLIKTSPTTSRRYIWTKFFFFFIPIFFFGQSLTIFSSFFIDIEKTFFVLKILTTTLLCFSLVSMAITFSISDLKDTAKESLNGETKKGSTIFMVMSVLLIFFTLVLESIPIFLYFLKESDQVLFVHKTWFIIGALFFVLLLVNILVTAISMHLSIKRFDKIQIN